MLRSLRRLLAIPDKLALLQFSRRLRGNTELLTAWALASVGAWPHLRERRSPEELARLAGLHDLDALSNLLAQGVRAGLLRERSGRYAARTAFARALGSESNRALTSMFQEVMSYHHEVFRNLPSLLGGAEPQDYLAEYGPLIAESSRIVESLILSFMEATLGRKTGKRVLEIGCGAGAYLAEYATWHPDHSGLGVELDPRIARESEGFLAAAGHSDRFRIIQGDAREWTALPEPPYDVVTAIQNVYYFDADQRRALWKTCREGLSDGGCVVIITPVRGGPMSDYFDLILKSTRGCTALRELSELMDELRDAGFTSLESERFIPGDSFYGIRARHEAG